MIFQPHRYSRTEKLWDDFVHLFSYSPIDHLIITDIYPASETPLEHITSTNLVKAILEKQPSCQVSYVPYDSEFEGIMHHLESSVAEQDLLLLLGAGKVYKLAELFGK